MIGDIYKLNYYNNIDLNVPYNVKQESHVLCSPFYKYYP